MNDIDPGGPCEAGSTAHPVHERYRLRIATVNNPDMVVMEELSDRFTEQTGTELEFVVLPENELRQQVTEDVSLGGGQYDIVTIGTYEAPFVPPREFRRVRCQSIR